LSSGLKIEIWVENPVVAPQSRWKRIAVCLPSGEGLREATVFWQASEHPAQANKAVSDNIPFIGADGSAASMLVNGGFRGGYFSA
jgi:hypothetical protein